MKDNSTRNELRYVFSESKPSRFKPPFIDKKFGEVCSSMDVAESEEIETILEKELKLFLKCKKDQKSKNKGKNLFLINEITAASLSLPLLTLERILCKNSHFMYFLIHCRVL